MFDNYKKQISEFLGNYLDEKKETLKIIPWSSDVFPKLKTFSTQGKLIRGSLLLLGHEMFGNPQSQEAIKAAAALEINQSAILIHDDIIDQDNLRRGKKSMHKVYEEISENLKLTNPQHAGISMAICVGDIGLLLCFELLNTINTNYETKQKILEAYSQEMQLVGLAEIQDVIFGNSQNEPTEENILELYRMKTGRYTFGLPLVMGAQLANKKNSDSLMKLGEMMGIIFQISDDELSIFGKEEQTGKPVGTDIIRNNKTLFRNYLFANSTSQEKEKLTRIFGNLTVSASDISFIQNEMIQKNIVKMVNEKINQLEQIALNEIHNIQVDEQYKQILKNLLKFCIQRDK